MQAVLAHESIELDGEIRTAYAHLQRRRSSSESLSLVMPTRVPEAVVEEHRQRRNTEWHSVSNETSHYNERKHTLRQHSQVSP